MTTVFIAGSISISRLHEKVKSRIEKIVASDLDIVVGDADGADTSIQDCLVDYRAKRVTVYCSGDSPRNNLAEWPVNHVYPKAARGSRAFFTAKDLEMAHASDYGLMVWDCKSTGTLSNVIQLIKENKKSVVFVNKNKDFVNVSDASGLEYLLTFMSDHARAKADEKIGLSSKIADISQKQFTLGMDDHQSEPKRKKAPPKMAHRPYHDDADKVEKAEDEQKPVTVAALEDDDTTNSRTVLANEDTSQSIEHIEGEQTEPPLPVSIEPAALAAQDEEATHAENMKLRLILIVALENHVKEKGWTQAEAARLLGVTQPRVSDLLRHKTSLFGLDSLVNMAAVAGLNIEMRVQ